jgi:hypothetical protein
MRLCCKVVRLWAAAVRCVATGKGGASLPVVSEEGKGRVRVRVRVRAVCSHLFVLMSLARYIKLRVSWRCR